MPTLCIIGYQLSMSEMAKLLESRGLIESVADEKDRARKDILKYRETHGYDCDNITEDDVIIQLLNNRKYSEVFHSHLNDRLDFNGVKCDVQYIDTDPSIYIGKVLGYDDFGYIVFTPDKVTKYTKKLRDIDPIVQDQQPMIHVVSY